MDVMHTTCKIRTALTLYSCLCRYRKLKQLMSRRRSRSSQNSQGSRPLMLLCKDEDMGQMTVITFLHRGTPQIQACEADIMTMRTCNAHPFIMHLHQVSHALHKAKLYCAAWGGCHAGVPRACSYKDLQRMIDYGVRTSRLAQALSM